jgi:hypothetical protein
MGEGQREMTDDEKARYMEWMPYCTAMVTAVADLHNRLACELLDGKWKKELAQVTQYKMLEYAAMMMAQQAAVGSPPHIAAALKGVKP